MSNLPETTGLTFPFKQTQNVSFSDRSLDVSDDGSASGTATFGIHEFDSDLGHVTGVSGSSQDAADFGKFDRGILLLERSLERKGEDEILDIDGKMLSPAWT